MATCWNGKGNQAIMYHIKRLKASKSDIGRLLDITNTTVQRYINRPYLMRLQDLTMLSGYFGIPVVELVHCIERNKPKVNKDDSWYLSDVREKGNKLFPKESPEE